MHLYDVMLCWINLSQSQSVPATENKSIKLRCCINPLYYIILYYIISYHIISYHVISYYITLYHIILYYIIISHVHEKSKVSQGNIIPFKFTLLPSHKLAELLNCTLTIQVSDSHYIDVIMGAIASQITSFTIVNSTVYSDVDQRKHQSSSSLAFVRGIHRSQVNSSYKRPVTRKMFPFDDVIMHCVKSAATNHNDTCQSAKRFIILWIYWTIIYQWQPNLFTSNVFLVNLQRVK